VLWDVWKCESRILWSRGLGVSSMLIVMEVLSEELMNRVYSMIQRSFSHT